MRDLSWAIETLHAYHADPIGSEGRHFHTWRVTVFWASEPFRDGRVLKTALRELLRAWRLKDLPGELWSSEQLARFILRAMPADICGVVVDRPDFGGCGVGEYR